MKLPKDVVADPRHEAVLKLLTTGSVLWERGTIEVPTISLSPSLTAELKSALSLNLACQGLEQIQKKLRVEQKGLDALKVKTPESPQGERISRVLFMANDGSERFFRDCESQLLTYQKRVVGCKIDMTGEELGVALFGPGKLVKAVLVFDKRAASNILLALVPR